MATLSLVLVALLQTNVSAQKQTPTNTASWVSPRSKDIQSNESFHQMVLDQDHTTPAHQSTHRPYTSHKRLFKVDYRNKMQSYKTSRR